jgi:hypothetical protein
MNNLKMPSYQPAPVATSSSLSSQTGGRGYNHKTSCICSLCKSRGGRGHGHKKGCKCPLCKRIGGGNGNDDADENTDIEMGASTKENFSFADDADYNDLDNAEKGNAGPSLKVGGSRRRKHSKKSKKGGKTRKTHRSSRKGRKHGRRTHKRR